MESAGFLAGPAARRIHIGKPNKVLIAAVRMMPATSLTMPRIVLPTSCFHSGDVN